MQQQDKPTIRQNLADRRFNPPQAKLNPVIVATIKRWLLNGESVADVHAMVVQRGYKVSYSAITEIKGNRKWATIQPS